MKLIKKFYEKILDYCVYLIEHKFFQYVSLRERALNYLKTRGMIYKALNLSTVIKYKKSNTIFILGSGPSINTITSEQWREIARHDSIGFNWWLLHDFVPTFYHCEYNRKPFVVEYLMQALEKKKERYKNTIFFISSRARKRGMHPRFIPRMFSDNPICCFYKYPRLIRVKSDRPFKKEDFKGRFQYRGSLNLMLYLAYRMQYKNIVLLGVDLKTAQTFYDNYKETIWMSHLNYLPDIEERKQRMHSTMYAKPTKRHSLETFIYAFDEFVLKPNNIRLYIGSKESLLYPKLPLYEIVSSKRSE